MPCCGEQVHARAGVLGQPVADDRLVGPVHELVLGSEVAAGEGVRAGGSNLVEVDVRDVVREVAVLDGQPGVRDRFDRRGERSRRTDADLVVRCLPVAPLPHAERRGCRRARRAPTPAAVRPGPSPHRPAVTHPARRPARMARSARPSGDGRGLRSARSPTGPARSRARRSACSLGAKASSRLANRGQAPARGSPMRIPDSRMQRELGGDRPRPRSGPAGTTCASSCTSPAGARTISRTEPGRMTPSAWPSRSPARTAPRAPACGAGSRAAPPRGARPPPGRRRRGWAARPPPPRCARGSSGGAARRRGGGGRPGAPTAASMRSKICA